MSRLLMISQSCLWWAYDSLQLIQELREEMVEILVTETIRGKTRHAVWSRETDGMLYVRFTAEYVALKYIRRNKKDSI